MPDKRLPSHTQAAPDPGQSGERRRLGRIVHDHKGNAIVEWLDAPEGSERQVLEIEGATQPATAGAGAAPAKAATHTNRGLSTGSLAIDSEDTHNPYMRIPEGERKRAPGQR